MDWPSIIRTLRERMGMSQKTFGEFFGASLASVYRWESGITVPLTEFKMKIIEKCRELGVPLDRFILLRTR